MPITPSDDFFSKPKGKRIVESLSAVLPAGRSPSVSGKISSAQISSIYGSSEEFLKNYESFQKRYTAALSSSVDPSRARNVDLSMLRRGQKIDLSVLTMEARKRLEKDYMDNVLRLPKLLKELGLPDVSLPSANLYRELFRYQVDTSDNHSASVLLNRTLLNINPDKAGMDAFNVGVSNLIGVNKLKQASTKNLTDLFKGKKVYTFDVETTGIFQGAQTRSMAIAEMAPDQSIKILKDHTVSFASKQLTGINVGSSTGAVQSFTEALFKGRKITGYGQGGAEFLDEATKFITKLTEADVVAGHNVLFDIGSLFQTVRNMPAFEKHEGIQKALAGFEEKWAANENFVVDTLEYTRTYLNNRINTRIAADALPGEEVKMFRELLFSDDFMSKIRLGGSTATSSMEAIAVNTNLLKLIEGEAATDDTAKELMEMLYKGTHIEDTDATLQSYMAKFIQTEQLDVMNATERKALSSTVKSIQSKILSSSAATITTNISDIQHLTETSRAFIETEEGMRGISVMSEVDVPTKGMKEGIIQYNSDTGRYQITSAGESYDIADDVARSSIKNVISKTPEKIRDLGINYLQNNQMYEIDRLSKLGIRKADALEKSAVLKSIGKTYSTFGTSIDLASAVDIARGRSPRVSVFGVGAEKFQSITDYNIAMDELAKARAAMGNPYYMLDAQSIKASTIMAESTGDYSRSIVERLQSLVSSGKYAEGSDELKKLRSQIDSLKYADYKDLVPEVGISHFMGQKEFKILEKEGTLKSKMFIPLEIMEKASGGDLSAGRISLSYVELNENQKFMNAVFKIAEGGTAAERKTQATSLAEGILKAAQEKVDSTSFAKVIDDEAANSAIALVNATKTADGKEKILNQMVDNILKRGIVIGSIEGESAQRAFESLKRIGVDLSNDIAAGRLSARVIDILGESDAFRLTPFLDDLVERGSRIGGELDSAKGTVIKYLNDLAGFIDSEGISGAARTKMRRSMLGMSPNKMLDFYINHKTKIGAGGLGLVAAGAAYYMSKKYRENRLYDETIKAQPAQQVSQGSGIEDQFALQASFSSFRRDPLVTAGIVGNLDRNKIGHHRMGNDKYNHLYGGA